MQNIFTASTRKVVF